MPLRILTVTNLLLLFVLLAQTIAPCRADEIQKRTSPSGRPKVALALGGGGTRGAAHLGVLKVLEEEGIPIDYITGTSIGSIVGGLYAAGVPVSKIQQMAENRAIFKAYNTVPIGLRIAVLPFSMIPRLFGYHPYVGLYRGGKFEDFLNKQAPEGRQNIEDAKIPFRAIATDLFTGEPCVIDKGPIGRAMRASAAIPWLRKPVPFDGKLLCDGVLAGNLPVVQARDMGADIVIAVSVDGPVKPAVDGDFHKIKYMENRTCTLIMTKLDEQYVKLADLVLHPDVADVGVLSTNRTEIANALAAGEKSARDAMPQIRKLLQLPKVQAAQDNSATK